MDKDDTFTTDPKRIFRFSTYRGHRQDRRRDVVLAVGMRLVVDPLTPQKVKHRGRVGRVTRIRLDFLGLAVSANVTFEDNLGGGRWGTVDAADLRPPTDEESEALAKGAWPLRRTYDPRPAILDDGPRAPSLNKKNFTAEETTRRPPREDVEQLWGVALPLDAPELAIDPEAQEAFARLRSSGGSMQALIESRVARWLPSYEVLPCSWWGSKREASFYRLAVRAYEPEGTLACLHALQTKWEVSTKTGRAPQRTPMRWPRPWRTDGLLLADDTALAAIRGEPPASLLGIIIALNTWSFLGSAVDAYQLSRAKPGAVGALGFSTAAHLATLQRVRWPEGVAAFYAFPQDMIGRTAAARRLQTTLGPDVRVVDLVEVMAEVLPPRHQR
jgi:hypothetical protein